jgi:large conductance mechanosensitive channel
MFKEFKEFAMRGSVVDLAVGVIIGAAFGKIVSSLVDDVIMPPIGLLMKGVNFSELFINLSSTHYATLDEAVKAGAPVIKYGVFLNSVIDFLIVAFVLFLVIRQMNRMHQEAPALAPTTRPCPYCLSNIPLKATRCAYCTMEVKPA